LQQLSNRLGITPQSVKEMETREKHKTVTLKSLEDIAQALDMDLFMALYLSVKVWQSWLSLELKK